MRHLVAASVLVLGLSACGGGGEVDVASASTCEELADASIGVMQEALDQLAGMSMEEAQEAGPEAFEDMEQQGEEIEAKAEELDCDEDSADELLCDRVEQLQADGPVAEFVVEGLKSEC